MTHATNNVPSASELRRAAAVGIALGLMTLVGFLAQPTFEFANTFEGHKVLRSISLQEALQGRLLIDLAWFATALVAVHAVFGLFCTLVAIGTCAGFAACRRSSPAQWTVLWYFAMLVWVIGASATWYPKSNAGVFYVDFFSMKVLGLTLFRLYSVFLLVGLVAVAAAFAAKAWRDWAYRSALSVTAVILAAVPLIAVVAHGPREAVAAPAVDPTRPNVIFVGIDSLRLDELKRFGGTGARTPNLDRELTSAFVMTDTVTPLARTFPAWVSILTGRYPDKTGARVNLIDRSLVDASPTLADTLRTQGYRTIFATDEVRFANIDESYGFDDTITPRIGAADFLLGTFNDFPVSNLLANSVVGAWLFPHTYANRAAFPFYEEKTFASRLNRELNPGDGAPVFLAIHLTAAHWPYFWATTPKLPEGIESPAADLLLYQYSLELADRQFGEVMEVLKQKSLLDNALVVILSDHGEAMFQPQDRLVPKRFEQIAGATRPVEVATFGHGSSVLSPVQFEVLLALRGYGPASRIVPRVGLDDYPASLVDIVPTVSAALGLPPQVDMDGVDLLCECRPKPESRVRFTETEFNLPALLAGELDPAKLASQGIDYYEVDHKNGRLEIRAEKLPEIDFRRERAALSSTRILAALPTLDGDSRFLLADRTTGEARVLLGEPPVEDADALALWRALHQKYANFLGKPAS